MNKILIGGGYHPTIQPQNRKARDHSSSDAYPLTLPAWVALPGAYIPTSITLKETGIHKPPHHIKMLVNEQEQVNKFNFLGCYTSHLEKLYVWHYKRNLKIKMMGTQMKLYKTMEERSGLHGSETWVMTHRNKSRQHAAIL
jgi:hypothetical protein